MKYVMVIIVSPDYLASQSKTIIRFRIVTGRRGHWPHIGIAGHWPYIGLTGHWPHRPLLFFYLRSDLLQCKDVVIYF